jgi:hypothetical protein
MPPASAEHGLTRAVLVASVNPRYLGPDRYGSASGNGGKGAIRRVPAPFARPSTDR